MPETDYSPLVEGEVNEIPREPPIGEIGGDAIPNCHLIITCPLCKQAAVKWDLSELGRVSPALICELCQAPLRLCILPEDVSRVLERFIDVVAAVYQSRESEDGSEDEQV